MDRDTAGLLENISLGDESSFEVLYSRYFRRCMAAALCLTRQRALAEDVVSEVFLALWIGREGLPRIRNFEAYLYAVLRNHALTLLRKNRRHAHATCDTLAVTVRSGDLSPEEQTLRGEFDSQMQQAFSSLPERSRAVYYMVREERMSHAEIAIALGVSLRTVNTHMTIAVRRMTALLKEYFLK
jgi:RNA polymerase sigma-70 factor (ECF subfamily)